MSKTAPAEIPDQAIIKRCAEIVRTPFMDADGRHRAFFHAAERAGVHVLPVHFYSVIPEVGKLPDSIWKAPSKLRGIQIDKEFHLHFLKEIAPQFQDELRSFPVDKPEDFLSRPVYYHNEPGFGAPDAHLLYSFLRHHKPRQIIEVGSGFSTLCMLAAVQRSESGKVTCIEPYPHPFLSKLDSVDLERSEVQAIELSLFESLEDGDLLFIDSSHVSRIGSDVNYLFFEVLPRLKPGVFVHIHDIFFPFEVPKHWIKEHLVFWNEQYLLQAFLMYNSAFKIYFSNSWAAWRFTDAWKEAFPLSPYYGGGSIILRRVQ